MATSDRGQTHFTVGLFRNRFELRVFGRLCRREKPAKDWMRAMAPLPPFPWIDVAIILALIVLNGVFAMAELAIVSSRKPRLEAMARAKKRGARTALALASDPGKFLSTTQIGITLIGILAGAYSGASLGGPVAARLGFLGLSGDAAQTIGFGIVIAITTYASLVVGELVPKQIALRAPEPIAALMAIAGGMALLNLLCV